MYGTEGSVDESRRRLDDLVTLFDGSERAVRAFVLEGERPYAAMIDSDSDGEVPFLWVGYWSSAPQVDVPPDVEVISAASFDVLLGRRRLEKGGPAERSVSLRGNDGDLIEMQPHVVPGFVEAWVGSVDGAAVALCARVPLGSDAVVGEAHEVGGVVRAWRRMVDTSL